MLNDLGLPQQALVHRQLLKSRLLGPHPIDLGVPEGAGPFREIGGIVSDVAALYLRCFPRQQMAGAAATRAIGATNHQ